MICSNMFLRTKAGAQFLSGSPEFLNGFPDLARLGADIKPPAETGPFGFWILDPSRSENSQKMSSLEKRSE